MSVFIQIPYKTEKKTYSVHKYIYDKTVQQQKIYIFIQSWLDRFHTFGFSFNISPDCSLDIIN